MLLTMKNVLLLITFCVLLLGTMAHGAADNNKKSVHAVRTSVSPAIDGFGDDEIGLLEAEFRHVPSVIFIDG